MIDAIMAPEANRAPRLWVIRTPSRRDDETTLPRMAGDAGLLTSTTTSALEFAAATYAYTPLTATPTASIRRDDETTLPRMTGDVGLLTSTTTSEREFWPAT
ncbi:hypothetical protein Ctob_016508 [Chrysochromulina tobinii]|jgi:hypothetical protein|uniref:Uncharacterized protein n=1 Tax=Chrysochromulina tobinii TaxID=1460289 RepID=A0A0M0KBC1_9EUKA|nr:hypothetical protein Ctob_016508 [Chrysochromulina tobinii]|eukprot:KOO36136.1 hypothetical protein Ctob_016508 [Chrysochromulina sp. CCMP291]